MLVVRRDTSLTVVAHILNVVVVLEAGAYHENKLFPETRVFASAFFISSSSVGLQSKVLRTGLHKNLSMEVYLDPWLT